MKKKNIDRQSEKTEKGKLIEALLGSDDDLEAEECSEEYLSAFGIDPSTLVSEFKEHLQEKAREQQAERGSVSDSITSALRSLRAHMKASDPMNVEPDSYIDQLLGGTLPVNLSNSRVAYAFRNQTDEEMPDGDKEILDGLKAELERGDQKPAR